eukprot:TRINITY_DN7463_c0_g1_i1.p1 TRINITY_DN7463_c0_g1~~TRINITY_DN7463_c0_g1_i1.p1  ORF type:complete len:564 (+),score=88.85 TRINITY_DN7463_c0_g1_i1:44-1735(+)
MQSCSQELSYVNIASAHPKVICPICHNPFVCPQKTPCKHIFCNLCIRQCLVKQAVCPLDRLPLTQDQLTHVDDILLEMLDELEVYCSGKQKGCPWRGPRGNLAHHSLNSCQFQSCEHADKGCETIGSMSSLISHQSTCDLAPIKCPEGCGTQFERRKLKEHLSAINCPVLKQTNEAEEKRIEELTSFHRRVNPPANEVVRLNVGGRLFITSLQTLRKHRLSRLSMLFSGRFKLEKFDDGSVFLDVNPIMFAHILDWLISGIVPTDLDSTSLARLIEEAKFWELPELVSRLTVLQKLNMVRSSSKPNRRLICKGADLSGLNLSGLDLSNAVFEDCVMRSVDMSGVSLEGSRFENVDLSGANMCHSSCYSVKMQSINLSGADLHGSQLTSANLQGANLQNSDLRNVNLASSNLSKSNLSESNLSESNLSYANLSGSNLSKAKLVAVVAPGVNMTEANLSETDLTSSDLKNANLEDANMCQANLSGSDLRYANLQRADLRAVKINGEAGKACFSSSKLENVIHDWLPCCDLKSLGLYEHCGDLHWRCGRCGKTDKCNLERISFTQK